MQQSQFFKNLTLLLAGVFLSEGAWAKAPISGVKKASLCQKGQGKKESTKPISLKETLERSYMGNADLDAARAGLRATDEDVATAYSDWRPSLSAEGGQNYVLTYPGKPFSPSGNTVTTYGAALQQNIYKGGATVAGIGKAESDVSAGKAGLFVTEQKTLFAGVQAHTDIVAKEQILKFQENNKKFTESFLAQIRVQYEVGEKSRTDVEIALGEYEKAKASLTTSIGALETAKATYKQLTGLAPGALSEGRLLINVPDTYEDALCIAKTRNPFIAQATYALKAAEYVVDLQISKLLPSLDVTGSVGGQHQQTEQPGIGFVNPNIGRQKNASIGAKLTVPIYLQGKPSAQVRQAYQNVGQAKVNLVGAQRGVEKNTRESWEILLVARENVKSILAQVKALELSVEGAVEEASVGLKSVIDVLLQQQRLVDAQVKLAEFQKSLVDANYQLLAAMGLMTACEMKLNVKTYDPDTYYNEYQNAWIQFWQGEDLRYVKDGDVT